MTKEREKHPFPIRRWSLRNFKSVERADLDLAPLTILVGPNSSGKSSLLQSMLLIAQAAQEGPDDLLSLNGSMVELGDFQDVLFAGKGDASDNLEQTARTRTKHFEIGAAFDLTASGRLRLYMPDRIKHGSPGAMVSWYASFGSGPRHKDLGAAYLTSASLSLRVTGEEDPEWSFETTGSRLKELEAVTTGRFYAPILPLWGRTSQRRSIRQKRRASLSYQEVSRRKTAGLVQAGGIPIELFYEVDRVRSMAEEVLEPLERQAFIERETSSARESDSRRPEGESEALQHLADAVAAEVRLRLEEMEGEEAHIGRQSRAKKVRELAPLLALPGRKERVVKIVAESVKRRDSVLCPIDPRKGFPFGFERLSVSLLAFLSSELLYLGPLREDPRVVYPPTPGRRGNVGRKGEKAIALLHAFGDHEIMCPYVDRPPAPCELAEAVGYWLREFGIAEGIETKLKTRLGLEPHLNLPDVDRPLDMTGVGVGVSQIFPVLVMGLYSQPGSVLLMEQPELHLHPALQQKLGDFLLACARSGRQLIVETHSDHLISRLRRRIAEDESDEVCEDVAFVFAERRGGRTQYRRVEVNRFGGIEEWPNGFFDQAGREAQQILRAGLAKKRKG